MAKGGRKKVGAHYVRTRADGTVEWQARIWHDGKRYTRAFTVPSNTRREAERAADGHRAALRAEREGIDVATALIRQPGTVGQFATTWLDRKRATRESSTVRGYRHVVAQIIERFGTIRLDELTSDDVQAWYNDLIAAGMTPATLAHYHSVLRGMLTQARKERKVTEVATFAAERPTVIRKPLQLPRDSDVAKTIAALPIGVVVAQRLAAATGLRAGELCGLRYSAVRGREIVVDAAVSVGERGPYLKAAKSNRERTVAVDGATMRLLALHRSEQRVQARALGGKFDARGGFVLANIEADPTGHAFVSPPWLCKQWAKNRGKLDIGTHGLRHWYATKLMQSGQVTIADLSSMLGHAQVSTTVDIYTHADPTRRRLAAAVMGPLLNTEAK